MTAEERFALRPQAIEDLIDRMLMQQEARRLKLQPTEGEIDATLASVAPKYDGSEGCRADAADAESREDITARLMVDHLLAKWLDGVRPPKIHELREFYRKNQEMFRTPELIAAAHIVKHTKDGEEGGETLLSRSAPRFLPVKTLRRRPNAFRIVRRTRATSADFPRGVMVDEFDDAAFDAPVGKSAAPFRTQFGWHIALVRDRKPEGVRKFDEVSGQIQTRLLNEKQEREVGEKLNALRNKAEYVKSGRL